MEYGHDENLDGHSLAMSQKSEALINSLKKVWTVAEPTEGPSDSFYPVATLTDGRRLRASVARDGRRLMLIPTSPPAVRLPAPGGALGCNFRSVVFDNVEVRFIEVSCGVPELFDVFNQLLANIIKASESSDRPEAAAVAVIGQWRKLLKGRPPLEAAVELGLFAELHILNLTTGGTAWDPGWWRGPLHEAKDIVAPALWIEVKGIGVSATSVHIHGVDQLADAGTDHGYLAMVTVSPSDDGSSVAELVEDLRARCDEPEVLDELVLRSGWNLTEPERHWIVNAVSLIPAAVCPRITRDNFEDGVPAGLDRVRYELDVEVLKSLALPDSLVEAYLHGESV